MIMIIIIITISKFIAYIAQTSLCAYDPMHIFTSKIINKKL